MEYTIKSGDTLGQLARQHNTSVSSLASMNGISDPNKIVAGATLKIPNITGTTPTIAPVVDINKITNYTPLQGNLASSALVVPTPSATAYQDIVTGTPVVKDSNTQSLEANQASYLDQIKNALNSTETATAAYNDVAGKVSAQNNATEAQKIGYGTTVGGITTTDSANNARELDRQNAIKQLGLSNELNAAKYKLDVAQNKVDNLKSYLTLNKEELIRIDEKAYKAQQANITAKEKDLQAQKTLLDGVAKIKQDIIANGGDPSIINGAKSISEAVDMAGSSLKKADTEVVKLGDKAAYLIDKTTGKIIKSFGGIASGIGGIAGTSTNGTYKNDLEALIGNVENTIPTKFGQATFKGSMSKARNDGDKISTIATVLLKNAPAEERKDFVNQTVGMKQLDKAIELLDSGVKTGVLRAGTQYTYNLAGKDFDPNLSKLNQLIISAIQPYRNSITGAAWGEQEDGEYAQLFGSTKYSPAELKQRLEGVRQIMKDKSVGALRAYADPLSQYGDMFSNAPSSSGKGTMDDHTFVQKAVSNQKIPYETIVNNTPTGQIPVVDNKSGQTGYVPINEYSSLIYTKI